ncbi:tumor necrosis factor receptor superfamily member 14-like [Clupea harengus]|uniref:Tumor necrosis factor receptor superfamily member 14-like n=1 Tax=Clupea harengus TaxID=7950 RepID=A0A8M1KPK9_CLUHA|nr:tumor necrosis factor receptor superfamily member 14-like [Clupea harengus]
MEKKLNKIKLSFNRYSSLLANTMLKGIIYGLILFTIITPCNDEYTKGCDRAEYDSENGCCPVCSPGYYVRKHCTEYTSTTCAPCPSSTFSDAASGLTSCLSCTVCDVAAGLRVNRVCSSTSDTLCEPLEGHYCTDPIKDGCRGAVEHTKCSPGQYIKEVGTASSDTVCDDCGHNTYSDGSFTSCRPHTRCESQGMDVIREGTSSSDSECGRSGTRATVVISSLVMMMLAAMIVMMMFFWQRQRTGDHGTTEGENLPMTSGGDSIQHPPQPDG